ncbi:gas vesicle protein K [Streptomyces sp. BSE6.1]|uniref:gas vesicle protein K n=1 Tax=Streptomyces sp. BSE6.1 TaxID=2605730 RepID=UPI001F3F4FEF|nr:gas vesicle protein K [Streptomyces sp. BSE6.1]
MTAPRARAAHALDLDPERVGNDLAALVLTVVELLRQLMERQAVRRFDEGTLSAEQEDRLGTALMLLDERMDDLCAQQGLSRSDLNLDLGPLGPLLADPDPQGW